MFKWLAEIVGETVKGTERRVQGSNAATTCVKYVEKLMNKTTTKALCSYQFTALKRT